MVFCWAVKNGKISEDRIDESLYRIFRVKVTMMDGTSDTTESGVAIIEGIAV